MVRTILYSLLALATLAAGSGLFLRLTRGHLVADESAHDLGEISPGERYRHDFLVRNSGWTDVTVSKVTSSCMCSKPQLSEKIIKAGESVRAEVEMIVPRGRLKPDATVSIFVAGRQSPLKLHLHGRVSPICELHPPDISLGGIATDEVSTRTWDFTVRSRFPEACRVEITDSLDPPAAIAELLASGLGGRALTLKLAKDCPVGPLTAKMILTVHDPSLAEGAYTCSKELRGYVTGPARAEPMSITVGSEVPAREVRVKIIPGAGTVLNSSSVSFISPDLARVVDARIDPSGGELMIRRVALDPESSLADKVSGVIVLSFASNQGDFRLSIPAVVFLPG